MALFGFGKDKKDGGSSAESVLAYLEDAQRLRTVFTLIGPKKTELNGTVQGIDESAGLVTFQVSGPMIAEKGSKASFVYIQDSLRIGASTTVAELRPGTVVLDLPDSLTVKERRGQPRARLNPKEGASLTALTGLFDGVGITGSIENISESGARIKVDKAMNIKGEKRLPLGTALVPVGQIFMLIKLNKLPKCPAVMELEGRAVYLDQSGGSLTLGISFEKVRSDFASALRGLANSRTTTIPSSVPPKTRRKAAEPSASPSNHQDEEETSLLPPPRRDTPAPPEPKPVPAPAPPPPPSEEEAPATAPAAPRNDALARMKKRSRAVVALTPNQAFCDLLGSFLQEDGYGRVMVTTSLEECLGFLQQPNLGLLLLDGNQSTLESLAFVRKIKEVFHDLPPVVLAAEDVSTSIVIAAHRSGVSQMLVKPYPLDETLSELLSKQMGL